MEFINTIPSLVRYVGLKTMRMDKIRMHINYWGDSRELIQYLKSNGILLGKVRIKDSDKGEDQHSLTVTRMIRDDTYITDVYDAVRKNEKVVYLDVEGI